MTAWKIPQTDQDQLFRRGQRAAKIEEDLNQLETQLTDFREIDPRVLVSPFKAEAVSVNNIKLNSSTFLLQG